MAGAGLVFLVAGILAITAGLGMMAFNPQDRQANAQGLFADEERTAAEASQDRMGQTVAVGGGAVAFLGLIFIVVGRGALPTDHR